MNEIAAVEIGSQASDGPARKESIPAPAMILGLLWLAIPAAQYLGSVERTEAAINPAYTPSYLGSLDLSPWYVLLLGATILYSGLGALRQWSDRRGSAGNREQ